MVRTSRGLLPLIGMLAVFMGGVPAGAQADAPGRIESIQLKGDGSATKVIIMLSRPLAFAVHVLAGEPARKTARRLVLDFESTTLGPDAVAPIKVDNGLVQQVRTGQPAAGKARIVLDLARDAKHDVQAYESPPHVNVALTETSSPPQ